jgi:HK97 family phage portal protein
MRLPFGLQISRRKSADASNLITAWPFSPGSSAGGWFPIIRESFAGAWQRGIVASVEDVATHPTFFAAATQIAGDVAKCRPMLIQEVAGVCKEVDNPAYSPVLSRPNHYQNRIQFYAYWILSKIFRGNAYALKERHRHGVVSALYLLDPTRVRPMVTPAGDVYYALGQDVLAGVTEQSILVPARDIIHDSWNCLYHPLVGLSPIYASGHAAMQSLTIVSNATRMFRKGLKISGVLTAPGQISKDTAERLSTYYTENFTGEENTGKIMVAGDGLVFTNPAVMSAVDAQMIELLKWDDEKVCATLHFPAFMAGVGPLPSYNNVEALGQIYYGQCLQVLFESLELCLTEGLEMKDYEIEFDLDALDRMDSVQRMEVATKGASGGVLRPNEARRRFSRRLGPVSGGDQLFMQKQNWPIDLLGSDSKPKTLTLAPASAPEPAKALDRTRLDAAVVKHMERAAA